MKTEAKVQLAMAVVGIPVMMLVVEPQRHHQVAQPVSRSLGQLQQRRAKAMPADAHHGLDRRWPRRGGAKEASQNAASSVARPASPAQPRPTPILDPRLVYRGALTSERERGAVKSPLQAL